MILACVLQGATPSVLLGERATMKKTILAGILVLALAPGAANAVLYSIAITPDGTPLLTGSGQVDFVGDLSTDGLFALASTDVNAFSLTMTGLGATVTAGLADIGSYGSYRVTGGELVNIGIAAFVSQGSGGCPSFGGGVSCTLELSSTTDQAFLTVPTSTTGGRTTEGDYELSRVPAPATLALLGLGLLGVGYRRRQRS
jgi:hypothetical protein